MRAPTISTLFTALLLAALPSGAFAQDYCVTCTGPDAKYHCVIGGDASVAARSSRGQMLCITQLAQSGGHASCSVSRTTTEPCEGKLRTVMFPTGEAKHAAHGRKRLRRRRCLPRPLRRRFRQLPARHLP